MRALGLFLAVAALTATPAMAAPGDQWILGIHHIDAFDSFTTYADAGYGGGQSSGSSQFRGNAYGHDGFHGVARVYWELSGPAINGPGDYNHDGRVNAADYVLWRKNDIDGQNGYNSWQSNFGNTGNSVPTTAELYTIEFYGTAQPANNDWQPIESQFRGSAGEVWPIDDQIPWAGAFGSNHQYIGADAKIPGQWIPTGPGPNTPESADFFAGEFGEYMWLRRESWLYAKWNFGFNIHRSWSAIRLTQVTENGQFPSGSGGVQAGAVPEPEAMTLLVIGLAGTAWLGTRRRAPAMAVSR